MFYFITLSYTNICFNQFEFIYRVCYFHYPPLKTMHDLFTTFVYVVVFIYSYETYTNEQKAESITCHGTNHDSVVTFSGSVSEAQEAQRGHHSVLHLHRSHRRRSRQPRRPGGRQRALLGRDPGADSEQQQPAGHVSHGATAAARARAQQTHPVMRAVRLVLPLLHHQGVVQRPELVRGARHQDAQHALVEARRTSDKSSVCG